MVAGIRRPSRSGKELGRGSRLFGAAVVLSAAARFSGVFRVPIPHSTNAKVFYRVAFQRLEDAHFLVRAERTNAAVYLAGYGVECIIKSLILSLAPQAQHAEVLRLFRGPGAYDYERLLVLYRKQGGKPMPRELVPDLARVNTWTTDMRYRPGTIKGKDARAFISSVERIVIWADGRL